jgi:hypothetical protein
VQELFGDADEEEHDVGPLDDEDHSAEPETAGRDERVTISEARALLERSRRLLDRMSAEDREEAIALHETIEDALAANDPERLREVTAELADLLFYVEEG